LAVEMPVVAAPIPIGDARFTSITLCEA
jgi:hypothetical protein